MNLDRDEIRDHGVKGRTERESVPGRKEPKIGELW